VKTFAVLVFIAGVAAVAIGLARAQTVADGRVLEAELLALTRDQGVIGMTCDARVPIDRHGARFSCTAMLAGGATQLLACELDRRARMSWTPVPRPALNGIATPDDPHGARP
jgi:hypothetical protein